MPEIESGDILDGTIVNADVSATAAIELSKLQNGTRIPVKEANGDLILGGLLSMSGKKINNVEANTDNAGVIVYSQLTGAISGVNATIAANQAENIQEPDWVPAEVPTGALDGTNKDFTLAYSPRGSKVQVYKNGLFTKDFTINGAVITMTTAPSSTSDIVVSYFKS